MPISSDNSESSGITNGELGVTEEQNMSKLAGFHNIIPVFDGESSVTIDYFVKTFEKLADTLQANPTEKLLILKSKIRGSALASIIASIELSNEDNYDIFKKKIVEFFGEKTTLAHRQQAFSGCRMFPGETIKQFGTRVINCSLKFLGQVDMTNEEIRKILDNAKLAKFMEGVLSKYKKHLLEKDFQTFDEAFKFLQILEVNEKLLNEESISNVTQTNPSLEDIIARQSNLTHQSIAALSREISELRINSNDAENSRRNISHPIQRNDISRRSTCRICNRNGHYASHCFFRNEERRTINNPQRRDWSQPRTGSSNRNGSANRFGSGSRESSGQQQMGYNGMERRREGDFLQRESRRVRFQSPSASRPFERCFGAREGFTPNRGNYGNRVNPNFRHYGNDYQQRNYENSINRNNSRRDGHLNSRGAIMRQ